MKILSISIAICLFSYSAFAYEPAMLKSTGEMTDGYGNVIGVLNKNDPRNSATEYYYFSIDSKGNLSKESTHVLTNNPLNPLAGFVKYDLTKNEYPPKNQDKNTTPNNQVTESADGSVKNYGQTTSYNVNDVNKPRYEDYKLEPLYK